MSRSSKVGSELYASCRRQDETTKKGLCLLELRRTTMVQWGACGGAASVDQQEGNNPQISSSIVKEEQKDDEEAMIEPTLVSPKILKRRRLDLHQLREARAAKSMQKKQTHNHKFKHENSIPCKKENSIPSKKENFIDRWSVDRYKLAERRMLEVMKAEGAAFENPIPRQVLRMAARKYIPDTGLLDHLLKHIDGKVAPGGTERFRRCYNTEGTMEYWLESADLVKIKHEAGVPDPNWVPPSSWWKPSGGAIRESVSTGELTLLKEEIAKLKRDMDELLSKNQDQNQVNPVEEMHMEMIKWRNKTDQRLMEISSSLSGMQDMYQELIMWKSKAEQQLMEISNSLSSMQASKQCTTFSPVSERWEDWLESTNLDNIQGEDFAPWLGSTDLVHVGQHTLVQECLAPQPWLKPCDSHSPSQEPICARELELLKEEMAKVKRDVQVLLPKRVEDAQASVTPDSSTTNSLKFDLENPFVLFQEMFKELVKWKGKMEEQMLEISNSVSILRASKQYTP